MARRIFESFVMACLVCLLILGLGQGAWAADESEVGGEAPYRFAVVDMATVLGRSPQSAEQSRVLSQKFADRERALAAERDKLRQAEDAFNAIYSQLSDSDKVAQESTLRVRQRNLKRGREDLREEVRIAKDTALNYLQSEVAKAIEAIRAQESIDIIFRESDYIVASERVNITNKVLDHLQQRFEAEQNAGEPSSQGGLTIGE